MPLSGGNQFDENCEYKVKIKNIIGGSLSSQRGVLYPTSVTSDFAGPGQSWIGVTVPNMVDRFMITATNKGSLISMNGAGGGNQVEWIKKCCDN